MPTAASWTEARRAARDVGHLLAFRTSAVRRRRSFVIAITLFVGLTLAAAILPSFAEGAGEKNGYALAYANIDLYGHAPWLFGFGGEIMDGKGELAIASPQGASAMEFARKLVAEKIAPARAEAPLVASLFNDGQAATAISGPWFITGIDRRVPWAVAELPIVSATGKHAAPFLGAEGVLMSSRAKNKDIAFEVMDPARVGPGEARYRSTPPR